MNNAPVTAEDLYLYAMNLLDAEEQTRIGAFLPRSPEARTELANVTHDLAVLALGTEQHEVPVRARHRLLKEIARERKPFAAAQPFEQNQAVAAPLAMQAALPSRDLPEDRYTPAAGRGDTPLPVRSYVAPEEPRRGFFSLFLPWAGWAAAAGLLFSTWTYYQRTEALSDRVAFVNANLSRSAASSARAQAVLETLRSESSQRFLLTRAASAPAPAARVTYLAASGSLVFQGSNLDPLPAEKTYELWLIPGGEGAKPIPAGTFKPDARGFASLILPELPKGTVAANFGVTMEDDGGAQTPTLPILMAGAA